MDQPGSNSLDSCGNLKKVRRKSESITDFFYNVDDTLCDLVHVSEVAKLSGATVRLLPSSQSGVKTFVIRGTRCKIRDALRLITIQTGEQTKILREAHAQWLQWVQKAFPELHTRSYFLPPVYIRRVPVIKESIGGQIVYKHSAASEKVGSTPSVQTTDTIDDKALESVLFSLKILLEEETNEVFICLSQFPFGSYLVETNFTSAVSHLPSPTNLPLECPWSWRRGDFDVLLIHKHYGFIIFEIKAVGHYAETTQEQIMEKLTEAVKQLNKAEAMLSHLVSDIARGVRITKAIACPNLEDRYIQSLGSNNQELEKDQTNISEIILTSHHLCAPNSSEDDNNNKVMAFRHWWKELIVGPGPDNKLSSSPDLYADLIARFCGPPSTVTVPCITEPRVCMKTLNQAVSFVGECYTAHFILFPEQLELLIKHPLRVFITGPPGTGKTVVLLLIAFEWLRQGKNVYILSTWNHSLAATFMLDHLLEEMLNKQSEDVTSYGKVELLKKNFRDPRVVHDTLDELVKMANKGSLYIIADEVGPDHESKGHIFSDFCAKLLSKLPKDSLYLWAANCQHNIAPHEFLGEIDGWEEKRFTRPLRSPPSVIRETAKAKEIRRGFVFSYDSTDHTDGLPVKWCYHQSQQHGYHRVEDCTVCGKDVATFLCKELRLDQSDSSSDLKTDTTSSSKTPQRLQYRDVLILSRVKLCKKNGLLKVLSKEGIPVRFMTDSEDDIKNVATASSNKVWAAEHRLVRGLERKVVVCLDNYDLKSESYIDMQLHSMSRCSSQLLIVSTLPEDDVN